MAVRVINGDLFGASATALLLSTDLRMNTAALGGANLLANFGRRWPEAWEDAEATLLSRLETDTPALGDVVTARLEDETCPFRWLFVANSLPHLGGDKTGAVSRAVAMALTAARNEGVERLASPVMVGGWRLDPTVAFGAMLRGVRAAAATHQPNPLGVELEVHHLDEALCTRLRSLLASS